MLIMHSQAVAGLIESGAEVSLPSPGVCLPLRLAPAPVVLDGSLLLSDGSGGSPQVPLSPGPRGSWPPLIE